MVEVTSPRRWSDADLTLLHLGRKVDGADRVAQVDRIDRVVATQYGESYLMWLRLDAVADLIAAVAPECPEDARSAVEHRRRLDPWTQLAAGLATEMATSRSAAEHLLNLGEALRSRIPESGLLLRDGILSPRAFAKLVFETEAVTDLDRLAEIDHRMADEIRVSGQVAANAAAEVARRTVLVVDAEGARSEREVAKKTKGVRSYPGRAGMAVVEITDSAERIAMAEAAVAAVASEGWENSRGGGGLFGKNARLADAAIGLLTGEIAGPGAKVVVHVITDGSTLEGGDTPGHLNGHGPIDAEHVRDIAVRPGTSVRPLDLTGLITDCAQAGNPYRPTAACETVVRALFGCCSWPGCSRPASRCQLDHVEEFNHRDPAAGGATCWCNLNPKCIFHHQLKTFGDGWVDDQIVDANGQIWTEVTTPHGRTRRTRAANHWLLPDLGLLPCRHGPPTEPGEADQSEQPVRRRTRTEAKHAYRRRLRTENRRNRAAAASALAAASAVSIEPGVCVDAGPPAF